MLVLLPGRWGCGGDPPVQSLSAGHPSRSPAEAAGWGGGCWGVTRPPTCDRLVCSPQHLLVSMAALTARAGGGQVPVLRPHLAEGPEGREAQRGGSCVWPGLRAKQGPGWQPRCHGGHCVSPVPHCHGDSSRDGPGLQGPHPARHPLPSRGLLGGGTVGEGASQTGHHGDSVHSHPLTQTPQLPVSETPGARCSAGCWVSQVLGESALGVSEKPLSPQPSWRTASGVEEGHKHRPSAFQLSYR